MTHGDIADLLGIDAAELHPGTSRITVSVVAALARFWPERPDQRQWLQTAHGELDDRTPASVILEGKGDVVLNMLEAAYVGLPT